MPSRRRFLSDIAYASLATGTASSLLFFPGCKDGQVKPKSNEVTHSKPLKISLAQWSLHRAIQGGELDPVDFPLIAKERYQIDAVEYVSSMYSEHATDTGYWSELRKTTDQAAIRNLLIMVDNEGDLGSIDAEERTRAVNNHQKWIDVAAILGCQSIRVNAFGDGDKSAVRDAMVDALTRLCAYAETRKISILIENHGLYSSDGQWVRDIIERVNRKNCGTLPDFGNWCMSAKWGSIKEGDCANVYDPYQGVKDFLPYAKGVSAKSYDFTESGDQAIIDYKKMLELVKASGFDGYIGIEYEGDHPGEHEGIIATKKLLERVWEEI